MEVFLEFLLQRYLNSIEDVIHVLIKNEHHGLQN